MKRELPAGAQVIYRHFFTSARYGSGGRRLGMGWVTQAAVIRDGSFISFAVALCNPKDQFSRRLGREIALGRALKMLERKGRGY